MALALKEVASKKKVLFISMLRHTGSLFNSYIKQFCNKNNIKFAAVDSLNSLDFIRKQMKEIKDQDYHCLFIDEMSREQQIYR